MILQTLKLKIRLIIGFGVILFFTLILGVIAVMQLRDVEQNTTNIYEHPFRVSNAVRDIKINVNNMNRVVNVMVHENDSLAVKRMSVMLNNYDDNVGELFFIISNKFLGNKKDLDEVFFGYQEWYLICDEIEQHVRNGNQEEAVYIFQYKAFNKITQLNRRIQVMIDFTNSKAADFMNNVKKTERHAYYIITIFILVFFILGLLITLIISRSIVRPIKLIVEKINKFSIKYYNHNLVVKGKNELDILETSVDELERMGGLLKKEMEERRKAEYKIKEQYEEIQAYSEQLIVAKDDLEILIQERTVKLRTSEEKFKMLLRGLPVGVYITDIHGKCEYVNEKWSEMTGISFDKALGDGWVEALHPEDRENVNTKWSEIDNLDANWSMEYRLLKSDKSVTHVLGTAIQYYIDEENKGFIGANVDISAIKKIESALRKEHDFNFNLMEISPVGIIVMDSEGYVTYTNTVAEGILNISKEDIIDKKLSPSDWGITDMEGNLFPVDKLPFLVAVKEGEPIYNSELMLKVDNKAISISMNAVPIVNEKDEITGVITVVENITNRIKTEKELIDSKEKAEESDRLKSVFLANMSHEIRTPMNGIMGFASLLRDPNKSPEMQQKYIDVIWNSTNQLLNIINDILDISKIEVGQIETFKGEVSINYILDELYKLFNSEIIFGKKPIDLRLNKAKEEGFDWFYTDEQRLKQILTNLLSNALKFTNKGYIEFGYTVNEDDTPEFYVKDTGIGIPKEKQESIFDRFRQADESSTRKYGGTGLGLAIVNGCIKIMDGELRLVSESGEGSTFFFTLSGTLYESKDVKVYSDAEELNYQWDGRIVLIVEDDMASYEYLKEILSEYNLKIIHSEKGFEAVQHCKTNKDIKLVLMDIRLPDIDGFQATKAIKELRDDLPIIAQTANAMPEDRKKSIDAGCDAFIEKPINKGKFLRLIDKYFNE